MQKQVCPQVRNKIFCNSEIYHNWVLSKIKGNKCKQDNKNGTH